MRDRSEVDQTTPVGILGWLAIAWMVLIVTMAVAPSLFPTPELTDRSIASIRAQDFGPSARHPFGLDTRGSDMFAKIVHGARPSILVSVGGVLFGVIFGGLLGLVAGYLRGRVDALITNAMNAMMALPSLVLALTLSSVFTAGAGVTYARRVLVVTLSIGIVAVPLLGRITRANVLAWSQRDFVTASRAQGARPTRIMIREVLPNVAPAMLSISLLGIAVAIIVEGGLAVLGVGIPAGLDTPSWGNLIATGRTQMLLGNPSLVVGPALMIFLTVLALNYLGDVIRARFDVRDSLL